MADPRFQTVADELIVVASVVFRHLRNHGYAVRAEVTDFAAPFTPTMSATRGATTLHIEVCGGIDIDRLSEWVDFGRSGIGDTRLTASLPSSVQIAASTVASLRKLGIGLFLIDGENVVEHLQAVDLAMKVELPRLAKQPARVRQLLGHSYEQFDRGEWREGFEDACNALEEEARAYFARWSKTGRILVGSADGPRQMTAHEIRRLTAGQLAVQFRKIQSPTSLDIAAEQALSKINPDRVERVHRRRHKRTEARLRRNVGRHMWLIVNILRQLVE